MTAGRAGEGTVALEGIAQHVWDAKYRWRQEGRAQESDIAGTWRRVAEALARVEERERDAWRQRFYRALADFRFLPGGRILAGAGTGHRVTLLNCFVMGRIDDSMDGIFNALKEGAITMQQGGGVGYDFSTLRPAGSLARSTGTIASGPVSFMRLWDAMCATVLSTGARRGAMMATLRCDHPDIEAFIAAKREQGSLSRFNLSVQVTDAFMEAVHADASWPLVFPEDALAPAQDVAPERIARQWPGYDGEITCRVLRRIAARELWRELMRSAYDYAEPGVLFVDRINQDNNLWYCEHIAATNPCGEIPLPPYGACDLGSVNLTQFVREPFTPRAYLDLDGIADTAYVGARMLDNVIAATRFPLAAQARAERQARRIGLGITGLADALIMLGLSYAGEAARTKAAEVMRAICHAAYRSAIDTAREKGAFPAFRREEYLQATFIAGLPEALREGIARHGIRNSHLTAIAPTGSISLLANAVSSSLEPIYAFASRRQVLDRDGEYREYPVTDYAYRLWRQRAGDDPLPDAFVTAHDIDPQGHLAMQAALQPYVDNAISKTVNVPESYDFSELADIYDRAHRLGLKGCTTFRPNPTRGTVLELDRGEESAHCCSLERESD